MTIGGDTLPAIARALIADEAAFSAEEFKASVAERLNKLLVPYTWKRGGVLPIHLFAALVHEIIHELRPREVEP